MHRLTKAMTNATSTAGSRQGQAGQAESHGGAESAHRHGNQPHASSQRRNSVADAAAHMPAPPDVSGGQQGVSHGPMPFPSGPGPPGSQHGSGGQMQQQLPMQGMFMGMPPYMMLPQQQMGGMDLQQLMMQQQFRAREMLMQQQMVQQQMQPMQMQTMMQQGQQMQGQQGQLQMQPQQPFMPQQRSQPQPAPQQQQQPLAAPQPVPAQWANLGGEGNPSPGSVPAPGGPQPADIASLLLSHPSTADIFSTLFTNWNCEPNATPEVDLDMGSGGCGSAIWDDADGLPSGEGAAELEDNQGQLLEGQAQQQQQQQQGQAPPAQQARAAAAAGSRRISRVAGSTAAAAAAANQSLRGDLDEADASVLASPWGEDMQSGGEVDLAKTASSAGLEDNLIDLDSEGALGCLAAWGGGSGMGLGAERMCLLPREWERGQGLGVAG
jgi:hypothetical protein